MEVRERKGISQKESHENRKEISRVEAGDQQGGNRREKRKELGNEVGQIILCSCVNIPNCILMLCITLMNKLKQINRRKNNWVGKGNNGKGRGANRRWYWGWNGENNVNTLLWICQNEPQYYVRL